MDFQLKMWMSKERVSRGVARSKTQVTPESKAYLCMMGTT